MSTGPGVAVFCCLRLSVFGRMSFKTESSGVPAPGGQASALPRGSSSERADTVGGHTARPVLLSEHATKEPRATRRQGNDEPCHDDGGAHALLEQRRNARPASAPREACRHALSWVPLQLSEREQSRKLSPPEAKE